MAAAVDGKHPITDSSLISDCKGIIYAVKRSMTRSHQARRHARHKKISIVRIVIYKASSHLITLRWVTAVFGAWLLSILKRKPLIMADWHKFRWARTCIKDLGTFFVYHYNCSFQFSHTPHHTSTL